MANVPTDSGNQVEPVSKPVDQPKILGITKPLPEPVMSILIVSDDDDDEDNEEVRTISSQVLCSL